MIGSDNQREEEEELRRTTNRHRVMGYDARMQVSVKDAGMVPGRRFDPHVSSLRVMNSSVQNKNFLFSIQRTLFVLVGLLKKHLSNKLFTNAYLPPPPLLVVRPGNSDSGAY